MYTNESNHPSLPLLAPSLLLSLPPFPSFRQHCRISTHPYIPTGDGMSTDATGVISPPHHQPSTVTAPVNTQQQLPAGVCMYNVY